MVLELRDKIGAVHSSGTVALNGHSVRGPVVEALVGLGFAVKQAEEATDKVLANEPEATTSSALRAALSMLDRRHEFATAFVRYIAPFGVPVLPEV